MKNIHVLPTDKPSRLALLHDDKLHIGTSWKKDFNVNPQNIYITSDEEIKEGDWIFNNMVIEGSRLSKALKATANKLSTLKEWEKIILTTDPDLIKDGVQAIDDEFLEWFIKNPSCEFVEVEPYKIDKEWDEKHTQFNQIYPWKTKYKIIIPQEYEQKCLNETLEEAAQKYQSSFEEGATGTESIDFIAGAKWQAEQLFKDDAIQTLEKGLALLLKKQERMYSEGEVFELITNCLLATGKAIKAEMKNIMTNDAYIEFSGSDLEKWFKQNKKK
jgi:hypothetical protein